MTLLDVPVRTDWEGLVRNLRREGTPERVFHQELLLDGEVYTAVAKRFGLGEGLDPEDPIDARRLHTEVQRFLGYDSVRCTVDYAAFSREGLTAADTAATQARAGGRDWIDEHTGPIGSWEDFEKYPWPDPRQHNTDALEWYEKNLPEDMCIAGYTNHNFEELCFLTGFQTLCYLIYDEPELVDAICEKVGSIHYEILKLLTQFDRVGFIWGSDDMGFRGGTMIDPQFLIDKILSWHAKGAAASHEAGKPYLLHSCGQLDDLMPTIVETCRIDAKHSFEDTIQTVVDFKRRWGDRISAIGGIDMDFLCRSDEAAIRRRVGETLDACLPGGGYCLGTGNSVANYIPLDSYLVMLDEGRRYGG